LRHHLAADKHQFIAKIIRERRLVIRMSGPLLAVLEAAGVAEGRTAAGQARKVTRKQSRHCLFDISALTKSRCSIARSSGREKSRLAW